MDSTVIKYTNLFMFLAKEKYTRGNIDLSTFFSSNLDTLNENGLSPYVNVILDPSFITLTLPALLLNAIFGVLTDFFRYYSPQMFAYR